MTSSQKQEQSDDELLKEEMEAAKETRDDATAEEIKNVNNQLQEDEKPTESIIENLYTAFLSDTFSANQKKQSEEAKRIVEENDWRINRLDGKEDHLAYHLINRSQDVAVRSVQRKWNKIKDLNLKARSGYLPKDSPAYVEFNVKDYVGNPLLKDYGISGQSTLDEVVEAIDAAQETIFQDRINIMTECFFDIKDQSQLEQYVFKDLTFLVDVAYSSYTALPY